MATQYSGNFFFRPTSFHSNFHEIPKILIMGEIGAGKSTFINYLCNYFNKSDLNTPRIAIPNTYYPYPTEQYPHYESNTQDHNQPKTNICTQYMFTDRTTNQQYLFIDTPGLSDTRNIQQNEISINKIIETIAQLDNLTSIIIVVNGSINRLTMNFHYALNCLNNNVPDRVLDNIIVVLAHTKKHELLFDLRTLNLRGNIYPFYMQNDAFASDFRTWTQLIYSSIQYNWNHSMHQIKLILQIIDSFRQISIESFVQMKEVRNTVKSMIHRLTLDFVRIQKIQDELAQLDNGLQQTTQDYTKSHRVEKIEQIDSPYHNTLCIDCNKICHDNCRLYETNALSAQISSQCLAMKNGICQQCDNNCSYTIHYFAQKTIRRTYETIHDIMIDLVMKYDKNRHISQEKTLNILETKEIFEYLIEKIVDEFKESSIKLNEMYLSFNFSKEYYDLIKRLQYQSSLLKTNSVKSKTEKYIKKLKKLANFIEEKRTKHREQSLSMQIIDKDEPLETKFATDVTVIKTLDLVNLWNNTTDRNFMSTVTNELHRRSIGKSSGPLSTPNEIVATTKFWEQHSQKTVQELSFLYHQLQKQIDKTLNGNLHNLTRVNSELFLENFIVQTLLQQKDVNQVSSDDNSFPAMSSQIDTFPQPSFNRTQSCCLPPTPSNHQPYHIGLSHLVSPPYPTSDDYSSMPPLPSIYSPLIQLNKSQSQPAFSPNDYQKNTSLSFRPEDTRSMPTYNQTPPSNISRFDLNYSLYNKLENLSLKSSSPHSSIPDVVPITDQSFNSYQSSTEYGVNESAINTMREALRVVDNARLLSMHQDAVTNKEETKKQIILDELERRCYGDYPTLVIQQQNLLDEKINLFQTKTLEELRIAQANNNKKIRHCLRNNDFTLINEIPVELIIEATILKELISSTQRT